jgi:DnaJ-class molecular chaperone
MTQTPETVIHHGWRDEPVEDNPCSSCNGWGTLTLLTKKKVRFFRTCDKCNGTGTACA